MNAGDIDRDTAPGRLYRYLKARPGEEFGGRALSRELDFTCVSTWKSAINEQLQAKGRAERIVCTARTVLVGGRKRRHFFYRWEETGASGVAQTAVASSFLAGESGRAGSPSAPGQLGLGL